ncbi:MAG: hypothetical protein JEZ11_27385 [Desulfobacterales bacterium]|nr:hypothetical protein [Desulfobacterales bacterium]
MFLSLMAMILFLSVPASGRAMGTLPLFEGKWTEIFRQNGITVYSQEPTGSNILAFRAVGVLRAGIDQVIEVLRKVEISREWMPDVAERYTLEDFSDLDAITYSLNPLPWPFANREMILRNSLRLDRKNKVLAVDTYSVDPDGVPRKKGAVRAHLHCGLTRVRPAGPGRTQIEMNVFVDPGGYIPAWLVNLTQRTMPYDFLRALEKKAASTTYSLRPAFRRMLDDLVALMERPSS